MRQRILFLDAPEIHLQVIMCLLDFLIMNSRIKLARAQFCLRISTYMAHSCLRISTYRAHSCLRIGTDRAQFCLRTSTDRAQFYLRISTDRAQSCLRTSTDRAHFCLRTSIDRALIIVCLWEEVICQVGLPDNINPYLHDKLQGDSICSYYTRQKLQVAYSYWSRCWDQST